MDPPYLPGLFVWGFVLIQYDTFWENWLCWCAVLLQAVIKLLARVGKFDRPFEATILCPKIVLVAVKSTLYSMKYNEAKIKASYVFM